VRSPPIDLVLSRLSGGTAGTINHPLLLRTARPRDIRAINILELPQEFEPHKPVGFRRKAGWRCVKRRAWSRYAKSDMIIAC
jgi:hypothetical protein